MKQFFWEAVPKNQLFRYHNRKGKPNQNPDFTCISSFGFLNEKINITYK